MRNQAFSIDFYLLGATIYLIIVNGDFYENRIESITKEYIESLSDEEFKKRAFAWRGRETILRNIDIVSEIKIEK